VTTAQQSRVLRQVVGRLLFLLLFVTLTSPSSPVVFAASSTAGKGQTMLSKRHLQTSIDVLRKSYEYAIVWRSGFDSFDQKRVINPRRRAATRLSNAALSTNHIFHVVVVVVVVAVGRDCQRRTDLRAGSARDRVVEFNFGGPGGDENNPKSIRRQTTQRVREWREVIRDATSLSVNTWPLRVHLAWYNSPRQCFPR